MSSVVPAVQPHTRITRILLLAILFGAAGMALSLWWVQESPAVGAASHEVVWQVSSPLSAPPQELPSIETAPRMATLPGAAARSTPTRPQPAIGAVDSTEKPAVDEPAVDEPAVEKEPAKKKAKKKRSKPEPVNCKKNQCIALTFDDGPGKHTKKLLKTLHNEKVPATFFIIGRNIEAYPDVLRTMSTQGHEVASHTWSHDDLRELSTKQIDKELRATAKLIKKETGSAPKLVRPPYGAIDSHVQTALEKRGESAIMWNVDTLDWQHKNVKRTAKMATGAPDGSIVLMHDVQETTVDAVPSIIKKLRKQGYTFVTVSDLLGDLKPGEVYHRR